VSTSADANEREEGLAFQPKFDASGLLTCVATDAASGDVLMVAHMNEEALRRTIASGDFIQAAVGFIRKSPSLRGRLMIELTESAAIDDLQMAERHLQALRREGCQVCLDDFGAGAASLAYLQQLSLDVVKIDGRYIRDLQHRGRQSTFIRHLVSMCGELGVRTLAEMVESPQAEEAVRRAGVDFAQGWLYGAPSATPEQPKPPRKEPPARPAAQSAAQPAARPARRVGAVDSWG